MSEAKTEQSIVSSKKEFKAPKIVDYGRVRELTTGGTQPGKEGPGVGNGDRLP